MSGEAPPRLKTNLAILVAGDAAGKLVNVIVFGRLGRILERDGYGQLEFVMAAIFVGALIVDAGLGHFGARAVARGDEAQGRILGRIMALRAMILVGVLLLLGAFAAMLGATEGAGRATLLMTAAVMLVPKAALCEWLFQGRNEMPAVTATTILEPLVSLAGTMLFVHEPAHLVRVPFILAAATATVAVAQQALARRRGVRPDLRHGLDAAGQTLEAALPLGLSTLAWAVRFFSPMIAVGLFAQSSAGAFGAAHRLTVSMHAVVWLYFFNLLPLWSRMSRDGDGLERAVHRSRGLTLVLAVALAAVVWFAAPLVTEVLYGAEYSGSTPALLRILVAVPAIAWVSGNYRFGLIAKGALSAELAASVAGAAFAVVAFLVIGSRLDARKAAWIFCGAEALTLIVASSMWTRKSGARGAAPPTTPAGSAAGPRP